MQELVLSPTDFVALVNQTLEFAYPQVVIEGELSGFRVAKNRWLYFSLKDDVSTVQFFGSVYQLSGPLEDGLNLRVVGAARLHPKFGFSVNVSSMTPVGEGSIKKGADLLRAKLETERLFEASRKRSLPAYPARIGLITAAGSAACADFIKILNERWGGVEVSLADVYVQGDRAVLQITKAFEHFNQLAEVPDVLVVTRGGGSAEDLAAFNDERVVRAVAASRIRTLVAIGHEVDESLAELAADVRASTPTNAAMALVPDKSHELSRLEIWRSALGSDLHEVYKQARSQAKQNGEYLTSQVSRLLEIEQDRLITSRRLASLFNPEAALKRGYAMVKKTGHLVTRVSQTGIGDRLSVSLSDGTLDVETKGIN